jgi:hypothetical protein
MRCNPGHNSYYICRLAHACACQTQETNMVNAMLFLPTCQCSDSLRRAPYHPGDWNGKDACSYRPT